MVMTPDRSPLPSLHQALNSPNGFAMMDSLLYAPAIPRIEVSTPAVVAAAATSQPIEPRIPTPVRLICDGPPSALHRLPPRDGNHIFDINGGGGGFGGGATSLERLVLDKLHDGRLGSEVVSLPALVNHEDNEVVKMKKQKQKKKRRLMGSDGDSDSDRSSDPDDQLPLLRGESMSSSPLPSPSCPSGPAPRPSNPSTSSPMLPPLSSFSYPFKFPTLTTPTSSSVGSISSISSLTSSSSTSSFPPIAAAARGPMSSASSSSSSSPPRFISFSVTEDPFAVGPPAPPKKKRKPRVKITGRVCTHCGAVKTSEWRMGPEGRGTLCNACGLRYRKKLKAESQKQQVEGGQGQGQGLQTTKIPMSMLLNSYPTVPPSHRRPRRRPEHNNNNNDDDGLVADRPGPPGAAATAGNVVATIA